jgi:hypothetical protein
LEFQSHSSAAASSIISSTYRTARRQRHCPRLGLRHVVSQSFQKLYKSLSMSLGGSLYLTWLLYQPFCSPATTPLSFRPQWAPQPLSIDLSSVCLHRHTRVGIRMNGYSFAAGVSSTGCNAHSFSMKPHLLQKQSQNLLLETNSGMSPKLASKTPTREPHLTKLKTAIKFSFSDWVQCFS